MKVFEYDICDGDKGIIFAETYERARELFEREYPEADPDCYDWVDINKKKYDYGASICEITEYDGSEKLVYVYN